MASPAHARRVPTADASALIELVTEASGESSPSAPPRDEDAKQVDVEDESKGGEDNDREFLEVVHGIDGEECTRLSSEIS
jgi:hypothetical protein